MELEVRKIHFNGRGRAIDVGITELMGLEMHTCRLVKTVHDYKAQNFVLDQADVLTAGLEMALERYDNLLAGLQGPGD